MGFLSVTQSLFFWRWRVKKKKKTIEKKWGQCCACGRPDDSVRGPSLSLSHQEELAGVVADVGEAQGRFANQGAEEVGAVVVAHALGAQAGDVTRKRSRPRGVFVAVVSYFFVSSTAAREVVGLHCSSHHARTLSVCLSVSLSHTHTRAHTHPVNLSLCVSFSLSIRARSSLVCGSCHSLCPPLKGWRAEESSRVERERRGLL